MSLKHKDMSHIHRKWGVKRVLILMQNTSEYMRKRNL